MSTSDVLGRGKLAVDRGLAEPFVRGKLIGHQPKRRIRFQGDQARAQNAGCGAWVHQTTLAANFFQVFRGLEKRFARQQPTPAFELAVADSTDTANDQSPRLNLRERKKRKKKKKCHEVLRVAKFLAPRTFMQRFAYPL